MARISGLVVAVLFAVLLGWTITAALEHGETIILPTGGVTDRGPQDSVPVSEDAMNVLRDRAKLQMWRAESGPSPGEAASPVKTGQPIDGTGAVNGNPQQRVAAWLANHEQDFDLLHDREYLAGRVNLPEPIAAVLQQPQGRDWRRLHNDQIYFGGGIVIFGTIVLLGLFLALRGRIRTREPFSGEKVKRFSILERTTHWITAISFILLALTGLIIIYGQYWLKPALGAPVYRDWAAISVYIHVISAIPFVLGVLMMAVLWLTQNWITPTDWRWLSKGGGLLVDSEPSAERFNAGQKGIFWLVVLSMLVLLGSGLSLVYPFYWFGYDGMQLAQISHAAVALIMTGVMLAHIYIGTVGMKGAFPAMWSGRVDRVWAKEHHDLWYQKIRKGEKKPAG